MHDLAAVFRALSDENRLAIFQLVRERCRDDACCDSEDEVRRTVSELAKDFDLTLSTVSHHLKQLKQAGLIRCEKRGRRVYCRPDEEMLERAKAFLGR